MTTAVGDSGRCRWGTVLRRDELDELRAALENSLAAVELELARAPSAPPPNLSTASEGPGVSPIAAVLAALVATGAFRVLSRLDADAVDRSTDEPTRGAAAAVIVDVETTGLDHRRDEVIELGMLLFEHRDGIVLRVTGELSALREPGRADQPGDHPPDRHHGGDGGRPDDRPRR